MRVRDLVLVEVNIYSICANLWLQHVYLESQILNMKIKRIKQVIM